MICKHCGKELKDGSKFCAYCGKPQQQTIPETPGAPVGQNGASVFHNKQMLLIIGSIAIGIVLILTALGVLGDAGMWVAVFADVGVAVLAILNAMRAMRVK